MDREKLEADIAWSREHAIAFNSAWNERFGRVLIAAEAHLATLPKMIETWHVEWADGNIPHIDDPYLSRDMAERCADKRRTHGPGQCIRVTGPHQQEIPA